MRTVRRCAGRQRSKISCLNLWSSQQAGSGRTSYSARKPFLFCRINIHKRWRRHCPLYGPPVAQRADRPNIVYCRQNELPPAGNYSRPVEGKGLFAVGPARSVGSSDHQLCRLCGAFLLICFQSPRSSSHYNLHIFPIDVVIL